MKFALLINPLAQLKLEHDTSLALYNAALVRGWDCVYFTQKDLFCRNGEAFAQMATLNGPRGIEPLSSFDIIFMRQDPPVTTEYIYATYALELAEQAGVLVVNSPRGLRDVNEKMFGLHFPQCTPPTLVTQNITYLVDFWNEHQHVVFKPLDGMGGKGIFVVDKAGLNLPVILETLTQNQQISIMAQRYVPEIKTQGDKRIILIEGRPVPYCLARFPKEGESRANLAAGGRGQVMPLTAHDEWLCEQLAPSLKQRGLLLVGIDVIGEYLTEINVTSPTCLVEIAAETGLDLANQVLDAIERSIC